MCCKERTPEVGRSEDVESDDPVVMELWACLGCHAHFHQVPRYEGVLPCTGVDDKVLTAQRAVEDYVKESVEAAERRALERASLQKEVATHEKESDEHLAREKAAAAQATAERTTYSKAEAEQGLQKTAAAAAARANERLRHLEDSEGRETAAVAARTRTLQTAVVEARREVIPHRYCLECVKARVVKRQSVLGVLEQCDALRCPHPGCPGGISAVMYEKAGLTDHAEWVRGECGLSNPQPQVPMGECP